MRSQQRHHPRSSRASTSSPSCAPTARSYFDSTPSGTAQRPRERRSARWSSARRSSTSCAAPTGPSPSTSGGSPANVAFGLAALEHPVDLAHVDRRPTTRGRRIARHLEPRGRRAGTRQPHAGPPHVGRRGDARCHRRRHLRTSTSRWELAEPVSAWTATATCTPAPSRPSSSRARRPVLDGLASGARARRTVSYDPNARPSLMGRPQDVRAAVEQLVALSRRRQGQRRGRRTGCTPARRVAGGACGCGGGSGPAGGRGDARRRGRRRRASTATGELQPAGPGRRRSSTPSAPATPSWPGWCRGCWTPGCSAAPTRRARLRAAGLDRGAPGRRAGARLCRRDRVAGRGQPAPPRRDLTADSPAPLRSAACGHRTHARPACDRAAASRTPGDGPVGAGSTLAGPRLGAGRRAVPKEHHCGRVRLRGPAAARRRRHAVPAADHRGGVDVRGRAAGRFLEVEPEALRLLTDEAMHDIAHYLRPAHLAAAAPDHRRPGGLRQRPVRRARPAQERQHRRRRRAADVPGHRHRDRDGQARPSTCSPAATTRRRSAAASTTPTPGSTCATRSWRR